MKYIVWKVTAQNFEEIAQFVSFEMAKAFRDLWSLGEDGYEITKAGETPVW